MNKQTIEVISVSDEHRRCWSAEDTVALVGQTYDPRMSVSLEARQSGVAASMLFNRHKLERKGDFTAGSAAESVVSASELASPRAQIAWIQSVRYPYE